MPSTDQTDLAGREWRTTPEERKSVRLLHSGVDHVRMSLHLEHDLETALAKIEALEAERDEARQSAERDLNKLHADHDRLNDALNHANDRATALEGALRKAESEVREYADHWRPQSDIWSTFTMLADRLRALNPDPAEQPEAGR